MTDLARPFSPLVISILVHPRFCHIYWSVFLCLPGGPCGPSWCWLSWYEEEPTVCGMLATLGGSQLWRGGLISREGHVQQV